MLLFSDAPLAACAGAHERGTRERLARRLSGSISCSLRALTRVLFRDSSPLGAVTLTDCTLRDHFSRRSSLDLIDRCSSACNCSQISLVAIDTSNSRLRFSPARDGPKLSLRLLIVLRSLMAASSAAS